MIKSVQRGLKLNSTHQLLLYADYGSILGRRTHIMKKNIEIDPEVNAEKSKYIDMSQDQNASQNHNIMIDDKSFERVEQFKYFGTRIKIPFR